MPETTKRVLVTGGSGYIAGYLIRQLLAEGWQVHSTLRSLGKEAAVRALLAVGDAPLRFFEADLNSDAGWAEAAGGCTHMAHVASPLPTGVPKDANELIVPAREGALRALRAAKAAGIAKVVMTSSVAAVAYGRGRGEHHFTEADWTDGEDLRLSPYIRSKALAERAARDWIAREGAGIEFCSINPSVVLGPVWGRDYSASVTIVRSLLNGRMVALADIGFGIVDVRARGRSARARPANQRSPGRALHRQRPLHEAAGHCPGAEGRPRWRCPAGGHPCVTRCAGACGGLVQPGGPCHPG
jgi:dihydroflavonol-4-reductase